MDIFTTQLTKVRQIPIKPEKLRVKSLNKDASASALDEDKDHLTGETQSPDLHPLAHMHEDEHDKHQQEYTKQEILQSNKKHQTLADDDNSAEQSSQDKSKNSTDDDSDDHDEHIDIFI